MLLITKNGGIDMRKTRKRVLELLAFVMVVMTAISCISFLAPSEASAAAYDRVYSTEYYYPSSTTQLSYFAVAYKTKGTSQWKKAKKILTDAGYSVWDKDVNDGAGGAYIAVGYMTALNDMALTVRDVRLYLGSNPPDTYTYNGCIYEKVGSANTTASCPGKLCDGAVNLNHRAGGKELYIYITRDPKAGPPITSGDINTDSSKSGWTTTCYLNQDQTSAADFNKDAGGDYIYYHYFSSITSTVNSLPLRESMREAASYIANASRYVSVTNLQNALKAAEAVTATLDKYGLSYKDQSEINQLKTNIDNALNALQTKVYFNANGGSLGGIASSYNITIGKNTSYNFDVSDKIPTRAGYIFKGWSTSQNASSGSTASVSVGFNTTLYAVWEKKTLDINFDNMFSLSDWSYNSISSTLNNKTDASVSVDRSAGTITVKTGANSGTDVYTEYGSSDCYKVKVEPNTTYRLQFDYTTTAGAQAFVFSYNLSGQPVNFAGISNPHMGVYSKNSGSSGITFTTSSTTEYVQFRFGNTAQNDTSVFSNIKVYKNSAPFTEITYPAVRWAYAYDSSAKVTGLITPARNGYTFDGWYTNVNGVGTKYTTDTNVPSSSITLWSNWKLNTYNLTYDSNGGTSADNVTYDITKTVQLPTPTRTGYTFAGWKPSADSGNWSASKTYTGELTKMYGDVTLVAQWNPISYTINYLSGTGESKSVTVKYGETVSLMENPFTKQCSEFAGWLLSTDSKIYQPGTSVSNLAEGNGDVVYLTAQWKWAHTYAGVVTTPPTRTRTGVMTYTCSVCGDSYTVTVPAIGGQSVVFDPNNGANANYFVGVSGVNTDWKPSNGKYIKKYNGLTITYDPANETFTVDGTYTPEGEGFIDFYNFDLPGVNIGDNTYAVTFEYVSGSRPADSGDRAIPCLYLVNANGAEFSWNDCNVDSANTKSSYTTSCNVDGVITAKLQLYYCEGGNSTFDNFTFKVKVEIGSATASSPAAVLAKNGSTVSGFKTPVWDEHKF